jgi:hypothetical protein
MTIKITYYFHQNNEVAYRSIFANMPVLKLPERDGCSRFSIAKTYRAACTWMNFSPA